MSQVNNPSNLTNGNARGALPGAVADTAFGGAPAKNRIPTQPIVLALVLVVSGGLLYFMRTVAQKSSINFDTASFEYDFQEDEHLRRNYERIMTQLTDARDPLDVALVDYGRSPFTFPGALAQSTPMPDVQPARAPETPEEAARRRALQRRATLLSQVSKLELHSVMGGRRPLARINSAMVQVGDKVDDIFTVTAIEGRSVTLEADGQSFTLTMEQGPPGAATQPR